MTLYEQIDNTLKTILKKQPKQEDAKEITQEEWEADFETSSTNIKNNMEVDSIIFKSMRDRAEKEGLIPDEDWMKKLWKKARYTDNMCLLLIRYKEDKQWP